MKKLIALVSFVCLVVALIGVGGQASAAEPIRLGAIFGLTGLMAPVAEESVQGLKLAFNNFFLKRSEADRLK